MDACPHGAGILPFMGTFSKKYKKKTAAGRLHGKRPAANLYSMIDQTPMSDRKDQDHDLTIHDLCKKAIIPDAVTPLPRSVGGQRFSVRTRVIRSLKIFAHPTRNEKRRLFIQLSKLPQCLFGEYNTKAHQSRMISFSTSSSE